MPRSQHSDQQSPYDPGIWWPGQYITNAGVGAAAGAAAGLPLGPWGAAAGGLLGGLGGLLQSSAAKKAAEQAAAQQAALDAELKSTNLLDAFLLQGRLLSSQQSNDQIQAAQAGAARLGLSPAAALGFEMQARSDAARQNEQAAATTLANAVAANEQRKTGVLQQYEVAQGLANNAAPQNYGPQMAQALAAFGQFAGQQTANKATAAPVAQANRVADAALLPSPEVNPYAGMAVQSLITQEADQQHAARMADPWALGWENNFFSPAPQATTLTPQEQVSLRGADTARALAAGAGALGSAVGAGAGIGSPAAGAAVSGAVGARGGIVPAPARTAPGNAGGGPGNGPINMSSTYIDPVAYSNFEADALGYGLRPEQITPDLYRAWVRMNSGVK